MVIQAKRGLAVNDHSESSGEFEVIQAHKTQYKFMGRRNNMIGGNMTSVYMFDEI